MIREWGRDAKIWEWLESWDYLRYIEMAITEYKYLHGYFVKHFPTRGKRIGKEAKIARLEVIPGVNARLGWVDSRKLEDVREIYVGDFENNCISGIATYPVYDKNDPFELFRFHITIVIPMPGLCIPFLRFGVLVTGSCVRQTFHRC
ncbi:MAG: hypothetical protein ACLU4N_03450 [Butyricimonas faecihominis]